MASTEAAHHCRHRCINVKSTNIIALRATVRVQCNVHEKRAEEKKNWLERFCVVHKDLSGEKMTPDSEIGIAIAVKLYRVNIPRVVTVLLL